MSVEQQILELVTFEPRLQKEFRQLAARYDPQTTDVVGFFQQKSVQYPHVSIKLKMILPSFSASLTHNAD